jgi:hypothetical protein
MSTNPVSKGSISDNSEGIGPVTGKLIDVRARALAKIEGHPKSHPSRDDREQAERELTGGKDISPREELMESLPESKRWDPVPGSSGHEVGPTGDGDEEADDDGLNESAQLVEEGMREAEHDQMLKAAEEGDRTDVASDLAKFNSEPKTQTI